MDTTTGNRCVCNRHSEIALFCGQFVVILWPFCGRFVVVLWPFCGHLKFQGHFAGAFSLGEKQMQYLTFGGKVNNNNDRSRGTTQRYVVATTTCDRPTRFQRRHELFQATNPPTDGKMELTDSCVVFRTFGYRVVGLHGTHTLGGMVSDGLRGQGELKTAKLDDVSMCIHPGRMQQQQQQPVVVPTGGCPTSKSCSR